MYTNAGSWISAIEPNMFQNAPMPARFSVCSPAAVSASMPNSSMKKSKSSLGNLSSRGAPWWHGELMRKSIGRSQAHSGALIAPFVEWHAVVARTPEEVEDGLVLMRDAIRESIREHSGTQSEEVEDGLVLMRDAIRESIMARACTSFSSLALSRNHRWSSEAIRELSTERSSPPSPPSH